jgi:metal-responsive CopG/Arc/MetJ family transcriptional regulator
MAVRVTIEIPQTLHDRLRQRAKSTGTTMRSLIVRAIENTHPATEAIKKGERVTGPLIIGKGKLGPRFPVDENPWDLIFP